MPPSFNVKVARIKAKASAAHSARRKFLQEQRQKGKLPKILVVASANSPPHDSHPLLTTIAPQVHSQRLVLTTTGPTGKIVNMDSEHDEYCCACRNGGKMYLCGTCLRVTCNRCIAVDEALVEASGFVTCPQDFWGEGWPGSSTLDNDDGTIIRYIGIASTRDSFPRCVSEPLAIISLILDGEPDVGTPKVVYETLVPYLKTNVCYINMDFNLGTAASASSYIERANVLVDLFETGSLKGYRRFAVFITTLSEDKRGDLHIVPGMKGASPPKTFFNFIFGGRFGKLLKGSCDNLLTILASGPVVTQPKALEELKEFHAKGPFREIIAFTQSQFQTSFADKFLVDHFVYRFIHLRHGVAYFLYDHQALGSHTNFMLFEKRRTSPTEDETPTATLYFWSHPGMRPLGHPAAVQCGGCHVLKPWKPNINKDGSATHTCKTSGCVQVMKYQRIEGAQPILQGNRGKGQDDRGVWYKQLK